MIDKLVVAKDSYKLNHIPTLVYAALTDLSSYPTWWPGAKFTLENDQTLIVKPSGFGSFTWTTQEFVKDKKMILRYEGMFEGTGTWELMQRGSYTEVVYKVELIINHPLMRWINKFVPVATLHSRMMPKVFKSLDTYLNNCHVKV